MTPFMRLLVVAWYTISCRGGRGQPPGAWAWAGHTAHGHPPAAPHSGLSVPWPQRSGGGRGGGCLSFQPLGGRPSERALRTPEMPPPQLAAGPQPRGRIASAPGNAPQVGRTGVPGRVSASPRPFLTPDGLPPPPSSSQGATCWVCCGGTGVGGICTPTRVCPGGRPCTCQTGECTLARTEPQEGGVRE